MTPKYIIFTDASVRRDGRFSYCSYAGIVLNTETSKYATYSGDLYHKTIVYAEAYAIYSGLIHLKKHGKHTDVLIVTDSKLCVDILTDYIPNKKWDLTQSVWKTSDHKDVKNQSVYESILKTMKLYKGKIRLVHINSHLKHADYKSVVLKLSKDYNIKLNEGTARTFIDLNNLADKIATDQSLQLKSNIEKDRNEDGFITLRTIWEES